MSFTKEYEAMQGDSERDTIFIEMEGEKSSILKRTIITKYPVKVRLVRKF